MSAALIAVAIGLAAAARAEEPWFSHGTPRFEATCVGARNSGACAERIEAHQLASGSERFARRGTALAIPLSNGESVTLEDQLDGAEDHVRYRYREFLPALGVHVVHVQSWEGTGALLVRADSGARTFVAAPPVASPNGRFFAIGSLDLDAGYNPNVVEVWASGDPPKRLWQLEPKSWGPLALRWESNEQLSVSQATGAGPNGKTVLVTRAEPGWKVSEP